MQYERFPGMHTKHHEDLDIAVITVDPVEGREFPPDLPVFTLGETSKLREGERASTIGHPLDLDWQASINTSIIARLSDRSDFRKLRFTKTAIERGSSGGPIFTKEGALIGMVSQVEALNTIAVKIDAMLAVLTQEWRMPINLIHP